MVTIDGRVKVLDFGVAKLVEPSQAAAEVSVLPTALTGEGRIVGDKAISSSFPLPSYVTIILTMDD